MIESQTGTTPLKWRVAVENIMREATKQELINRHGTVEVSFNYRWEHVTTVVHLALKLAELTNADREIVEAAAWLHDIRKISSNKHAADGAEFAQEFLTQTDFPPQKITQVANAIASHTGLWRNKPLTNLEAMVLWDADKLSKIGLTAVFHWTGGSLAGSMTSTLGELITRGRQTNWLQKTVDSMHTAPARRVAKARLSAYNSLWDTLERELNGEDLDDVALE